MAGTSTRSAKGLYIQVLRGGRVYLNSVWPPISRIAPGHLIVRAGYADANRKVVLLSCSKSLVTLTMLLA